MGDHRSRIDTFASSCAHSSATTLFGTQAITGTQTITVPPISAGGTAPGYPQPAPIPLQSYQMPPQQYPWETQQMPPAPNQYTSLPVPPTGGQTRHMPPPPAYNSAAVYGAP